MRTAGEKYLNHYTNFHSIDASSESTNLESESVDIITAGQSLYSYIPNEKDSRFNNMISEFELLFEKHNDNGTLIIYYETVLYYCKMK